MTNISMHSGDVLRIENGRGLLLAVRSGTIWLTQEADPRDFLLDAGRRMRLDKDGLRCAYASVRPTLPLAAPPGPQRGSIHRFARTALAAWLRMHRVGAAIGRRFAQAQRDEAKARSLAQLDARTLRDIGLGADSGHPLAVQIDVQREQHRLRAYAAQLGL